jgi:hypothetical protein
MANLLCMRLFLLFFLTPSPRGLDHADHRLPAFVYMYVLNRDLLLALTAMAIERFEQHGVGAVRHRSPPLAHRFKPAPNLGGARRLRNAYSICSRK